MPECLDDTLKLCNCAPTEKDCQNGYISVFLFLEFLILKSTELCSHCHNMEERTLFNIAFLASGLCLEAKRLT